MIEFIFVPKTISFQILSDNFSQGPTVYEQYLIFFYNTIYSK